jgi:hypothetical protein
MAKRPDDRKSALMKSHALGYGAAAVALLIMAAALSRFVMLWCPRGVDCETTSQLLFWSGLIVCAPIAWIVGMVFRDRVQRRSS